MRTFSTSVVVLLMFLTTGCGKTPDRVATSASIAETCKGEECRGKDWALRVEKPGDSVVDRLNAQRAAAKEGRK
jgi:hypothetical protein